MAVGRSRTRRRNGGGDDGIVDLGQLTSLQQVLLQEAARQVTIVVDGRTQIVRMDEVVARKLMQTAANGGQHAISNAIYQINLAQRIDRQRIDER